MKMLELPQINLSEVEFVMQSQKLISDTFVYRKSLCFKESESKRIASRKAKQQVPLWKKTTLTLDEAAEYSGIGIHKIRQLSDGKNCDFVLWNGSRRLIKRKNFDEYIEKVYSI